VSEFNRRILLIDDTPSIHDDFKKILVGVQKANAMRDARAAFLGVAAESDAPEARFELESAYQGIEGFELVRRAHEEGRPYALAFVDVRMPPGWDGVQTIKELWKHDPDLQVVICTAFADYSWSQMIQELGQSDNLLILKKPFDATEIRQLAAAMTEKWNAARRERALIEDLRGAESQARAYASSLETVNRALMTLKATAEKTAEIRSQFLVEISEQVHENLSGLLQGLSNHCPTGLEAVLDSSRHLVRTLDQILDLSQLEKGNLLFESEPADLVELVEGVLERYRDDARERDLTLVARFDPVAPRLIECDRLRVDQVLSLLVENALDAGRPGEVSVSIGTEPTPSWSISSLRLSVDDPGSPIPSQDAGRLFEPFAFRRAGAVGSGIGLALTRMLARLMEGDASHRASASGGSTFEVTLRVGNVSGAPLVGAGE